MLNTIKNFINQIMKKLITTIMVFLAIMKKGTAMQLTSTITYVSAPFAIILNFLTEYIFPEEIFIRTFFICLAADTVLGIWRHIKEKSFDGKEMFYGVTEKLLLSFIAMSIVKAIMGTPGLTGDLNGLITWFLYTSVLVYILGSSLANIYILSKGDFPPAIIMKRFEKFSKTLNTEDLLIEEKEEK